MLLNPSPYPGLQKKLEKKKKKKRKEKKREMEERIVYTEVY